MAFKGRDPVRTKIIIDNKITEEVNLFNYLESIQCGQNVQLLNVKLVVHHVTSRL